MGVYILEDLRSKTGINFLPFRMGITELEKYKEYAKCLEENDRRKSESLLQSGYSDIIKYMLDNNCKLEQEIISRKEPDLSPK